MVEQLSISAELQEARRKKKPVVALESTIISHGMPYPENRDTALLLEECIRSQGACPATIAIIDGQIKIGLSPQELETLARKKRASVLKVSTKDIPYLLVRKKTGATTVAATMYLAHLAGIRIFATGGIGGVHRNAAQSFDISADLDELARSAVAVVCSGAKSILDLGATLEYLETRLVPVIGYGTKQLPAFYTRTSAFSLDITLDTVQELASFLYAQWQLAEQTGYGTGTVIANPIPQQYSLDETYITRVVDEALAASRDRGIRGKECTPFLLSYIAEKTEKKSLFSNIELVRNNALLAAQLAVECAAQV